jgi:hypothetical protein
VEIPNWTLLPFILLRKKVLYCLFICFGWADNLLVKNTAANRLRALRKKRVTTPILPLPRKREGKGERIPAQSVPKYRPIGVKD